MSNMKCPHCKSEDIVKDFVRDEKYCRECGLVLSEPCQWNGGVKCESPHGYNYYSDLRRGVHVLSRKGLNNDTPSSKIEKYMHNIPNHMLFPKKSRSKFRT